jgi:hypothetical protein
MINVTKCLEFIALQKDINQDIDMTGETSPWKAAELDLIIEKLNEQEIDWIAKTWDKVL